MKLKPILYFALSLLVASCSSKDASVSKQETGSTVEQEGEGQEKKSKNFQLTEAKIIHGQKNFAFNLLNAMTANSKPGENFVIAPFNVATILAMLANGADAETLDELCETLGVGKGDINALNDLYKHLITTLPSVDGNTTFKICNSVWASQKVPIVDSYRNIVTDVFGAETFDDADFHSLQGIKRINSWISNATDGKIQNMLKPDVTRAWEMSLISANLFSGEWTEEFDESATYEDSFRDWKGESHKVPTMHHFGDYTESSTDRFRAARLNYGNGSFRMTFILQRDDSIRDFDAKDWNELEKNGYKPKNELLSIPVFKTTTNKDILPVLRSMNLKTVFAGIGDNKTNYSKLSTDQLWIQSMLSNVIVEVSEKGTEAQSVILGGYDRSADSVISPFEVNRPFIYVIDEVNTGSILFMGMMNKIE